MLTPSLRWPSAPAPKPFNTVPDTGQMKSESIFAVSVDRSGVGSTFAGGLVAGGAAGFGEMGASATAADGGAGFTEGGFTDAAGFAAATFTGGAVTGATTRVSRIWSRASGGSSSSSPGHTVHGRDMPLSKASERVSTL